MKKVEIPTQSVKKYGGGGGMSSLRRKRQEYCESRGSARIIEEQ